jgi:hypothetical protein
MTLKPILLLFVFCLALASPFSAKGQSILEQKAIKDMQSGFPHFEWLNKDPAGGYILSIAKDETDTDGLVIENTLIPSYNHANDNSSFFHDFFICKLHSDFSVEKSFVIDNAELGRDVFCGEEYVLYSMSIAETTSNTDPFTILLNGEIEVSRDGRERTGMVLILNKELEFEHYFFPSTGEIGEVAVDGHMAYLELRIPSEEPYIIVNGTDTVHNQVFEPNSSIFGFQTVVLCKYNLLSHQVEWLLRIGDVGYEELLEMHIDKEHNLVVLGTTNSTYFSFNGADTILNNSDHNPFVAKYSADGEFLLGIINQQEVFEISSDLYIDEEDNYYILSFYSGKDYKVDDTILYNPKYKNQYPTRGLIRKYNVHGDFQWAWQLEGEFESSNIYSLTIYNEEIIVSGSFSDGMLFLNQDTFYHNFTDDLENGFLLFLDKNDASLKKYIMTQGEYHRRFFNMSINLENNLDLFMRYRGQDSIFGQEFITPLAYNYGYLLKLSQASLSTLSLNDERALILVSPNPSTDSGFHIIAAESLNYQSIPYVIFDSGGSTLVTGNIWPGEKQFIETTYWSAGSYWLQMQSGDKLQSQLVIIQ